MDIEIFEDVDSLGKRAAALAIETIEARIAKTGEAAIILATGASQFASLNHLVQAKTIDWSKVTMFHLDEYIGLSADHPASFRKYLRERFVEKVSPLKAVHYVGGEGDPKATCRRLGDLIRKETICMTMLGIGENAHLAFNDPPANFETEEPYIIVELDNACRQQQFGEGWFPTFDAVPTLAISMSVRQILKSERIIASVPDQRKAEAVKKCVEGPIAPVAPASILRTHPAATLLLDRPAASLLK